MVFEEKVFICSPFAPVVSMEELKKAEKAEKAEELEDQIEEELQKNIYTALGACMYALSKGYVPYAPHLYFPQFMDDTEPKIREFGQKLGLEWLEQCSEVWVIGRRISAGMKKEIAKAEELGIPVKRYVFERSPQERIMDVLLYPDVNFIEMV